MDDFLLHLEKKATTFVADKDCNQHGKMVTLNGGGNRLSVMSTANVQDERQLLVNDQEVVLKSTLTAYVQDYLNTQGRGVSAIESNTIRFIGSGNMDTPLEAVVKTPTATESSIGIVKVVHEGTHGYPCPGFSSSSAAIAYDHNINKGILLRNGADDLEKDVFINTIVANADGTELAYYPTADRFRIPALPPTAKPIRAEHSSDGVILLQTTDGPFFIITNNNIDVANWKACKIANQDLQSLKWSYFPIYTGGYLYLVKSYFSTENGAHVELYKASYTNQTIVQLTKVDISGTNISGSPQSGTRFNIFNKIIGEVAEIPMVSNPSRDLRYINVTRLTSDYWKLQGDCYDFCISGNRVRVVHRNIVNGLAAENASEFFDSCQVSYVLELTSGRITPDVPSRYPAVLSANGSTIKDEMLAGGQFADWDNRIFRTGNLIMCYNSYTRLATPFIRMVKNTSGKSDFDNLIAGAGKWENKTSTNVGGLYGSPLKMNYTGIMPIGDNYLIGRDATGSAVKIRYDPYGSYSPVLPGYGPTNDREIVPFSDYDKIKRMCWVFDGSSTKVSGGRLNTGHLSSFTTYENGIFSNPVSISPVDIARFADTLFASVPNRVSDVLDKRVSMEIFKDSGLPSIASLTVRYRKPNVANVSQTITYMFSFRPNRTVGAITSWEDIRFLGQQFTADYVFTIESTDVIIAPSAGAYKLRDGNWALTTVGSATHLVGDRYYTNGYTIYNPRTDVFGLTRIAVSSFSTASNCLGTKELGFGWIHVSDTGESCYLQSSGFTEASIQTGTETRYTLVMSRTDAGDNVAVSQFGASKVKDKLTTLIRPERTVNGMDLRSDRVVTSQHIGGERVPNQRDNTYPIQQAHRDSAVRLSPSDHQHQPSSFTFAAATVNKKGGSVLGSIDSSDGVAFRVEGLQGLSQQLGTFDNRESVLVKLDNTVNVDYEV